MENIKKLIDLITLEKVSDNTYVGDNYKSPWGRVFGGQVLGQSLHAAYQTVPHVPTHPVPPAPAPCRPAHIRVQYTQLRVSHDIAFASES